MVEFIKWSERFSLNIELIDKQHKQLIYLINQLYDNMKNGNSKNILEKTIDELCEYTKVHFKEEEKIFEKYGYIDTVEHKESHQIFINEIVNFKKMFNENKVTVSSKILLYLRDWLYDHILKTDKKYIPFMLENKIK